jgi:hypothetical protein
VLGASGSKKWMACTMSAYMEKGIADEGSTFSREGTFAHKLSEHRLQLWLALPLDFPSEYEIPGYEEHHSAETSDYVNDYVDYVKDRVLALRQEHGVENVVVLLEQRLDFSRWVPEGFGTGDVVIIVPGKVVVIDLKFGKGVFVDGEDNPQAKLYGLGAYVAFDVLYDIAHVEVVIHQPRMHNVSGETMDVADLLAWADEQVAPRAKVAWAAYNGDRSAAWFAPGEHCSNGFCKARNTCAARANWNMSLDHESYAIAEPDTLTTEQLEGISERADALAKWASDVKAYLLKQAETGAVTLTRFKLVEGRSNRVIEDEVAAVTTLLQAGFQREDIFKEPELLGITKLEKLVGAKKFGALLGDLVKKPAGKTTLAPVSSKQPEVAAKRSSAEEDFT